MAGVPVLAIGPHFFEILPLSLQTIEEQTKASWPATKRFGVGPARQFTGLDEDSFEVNGLYFNQEWGGHAEYLALKATQMAGEPVELLGWSAGGLVASVFGTVVILEVSASHEHIHEDGIGRKVEFGVKLASFGGDGGPVGGLF